MFPHISFKTINNNCFITNISNIAFAWIYMGKIKLNTCLFFCLDSFYDVFRFRKKSSPDRTYKISCQYFIFLTFKTKQIVVDQSISFLGNYNSSLRCNTRVYDIFTFYRRDKKLIFSLP